MLGGAFCNCNYRNIMTFYVSTNVNEPPEPPHTFPSHTFKKQLPTSRQPCLPTLFPTTANHHVRNRRAHSRFQGLSSIPAMSSYPSAEKASSKRRWDMFFAREWFTCSQRSSARRTICSTCMASLQVGKGFSAFDLFLCVMTAWLRRKESFFHTRHLFRYSAPRFRFCTLLHIALFSLRYSSYILVVSSRLWSSISRFHQDGRSCQKMVARAPPKSINGRTTIRTAFERVHLVMK